MNEEMLKFLVDMFTNSPHFDQEKFLAKLPDTPQMQKDLKRLENRRYITVVWGSGKALDISVGQRAIDYFR